jgi:hypothetical protein
MRMRGNIGFGQHPLLPNQKLIEGPYGGELFLNPEAETTTGGRVARRNDVTPEEKQKIWLHNRSWIPSSMVKLIDSIFLVTLLTKMPLDIKGTVNIASPISVLGQRSPQWIIVTVIMNRIKQFRLSSLRPFTLQ